MLFGELDDDQMMVSDNSVIVLNDLK